MPSYMFTINGFDTIVNLLLLNMVDFEVILDMDWLFPYHAILDCHAKTATLAMPGLSRLEWRWILGHSSNMVVSYLKARRMVEKGSLSYLTYIRDSSAEVTPMDLVLVVNEFPKVFPTDLSGMPPNNDIDFCIDLVSGTPPISIPLYCMDAVALKELKDQLQDFLDKGFIDWVFHLGVH
ncbi:uncharacterized protein [Nicotiana tomentosiformis]|uniref:uncharacterized protein n=1 Tax=Nicotiana tomentosiformis TaxID=4098 RepID=UPI00388C8EAD